MYEKIFTIVARIPKGRVATYGQLAKVLGVKDPRVIGWALHSNKDGKNIPCHRVVSAEGNLASGYVFGGIKSQKKLLVEEGICIKNDTVCLKDYQIEDAILL